MLFQAVFRVDARFMKLDLLFLGIEAGVGLRNLGSDFLEVGTQFSAELFDDLGVLFREIVLFADVVLEIVELFAFVFVIADEFEVAFANDAGRLAALVSVMRIMPEERAFVNLTTSAHRA